MKKNLLAVMGLLIMTGAFYGCTTECKKQHVKDYSGVELKGFMPLKQAKAISDLYYADLDKSHISVDGKVTAEEDAKSIWYDLETIKQYIWMIEDTLHKQGCNLDSLKLGLHFYLAKYPDSAHIAEYGVDPSYANHQTVFITATYLDGKTNVDFDPYHIGGEKCKPMPLKSYLRQEKSTEGMRMSGVTEDPGVLNHGTLIPPPYGEGSFPSGN